MKIKDLNGYAESWPKEGRAGRLAGIKDCSEVEISCDVEELAKLIHQNLKDWENMLESKEARPKIPEYLSNYLSTQLSKYVRLGKG